MKSLSLVIQMKATDQYFPVVLFITMYKVILAFESGYEILKCDHLNESYRSWSAQSPVVLFITIYKVLLWNPKV